MPLEYGRNALTTSGRNVMCIADGDFRGMKSAGITLAMSVIPTNQTGSPLTLTDDTVVPVGAAYMRFGQVLTKITTAGGTDTVTISGTPTGGTFTLSVTVDGATQTTSALVYNATAAVVQAALQALSNVGTGNATVTGSAGGPYTVTFAQIVGPAVLTATGSFTGGTSPAVAVTQTGSAGENIGLFGPYDPSAGDGRQNLNRGECFILNRTFVDNPASVYSGQSTIHPAVFDVGRVNKAKIIQAGGGSHSLAAGPTLAEFLAAFPGISLVED